MNISKHVENMCPVSKGANHKSAPIPEEGQWISAKEIKDISGLTTERHTISIAMV